MPGKINLQTGGHTCHSWKVELSPLSQAIGMYSVGIAVRSGGLGTTDLVPYTVLVDDSRLRLHDTRSREPGAPELPPAPLQSCPF